MPLAQAKCTNCGANLQIENTKDAAICPYCGMAYVVEKAINHYNVTNHITAGTVNIYGGNSADFIIRAGTLEKYTGTATDVVIPNSVTIIGREAFKDRCALKNVIIPDSVTTIGYHAFGECTGLTSVTIPNSIITIDTGAFYGCTGLTSVTIPDNITTTGHGVFYGCTSLTSVTIPNSVTTISGSAFSGCTSLTNVTIPNSVTTIENDAFHKCISLTSVTIPNSVTTIGGGFNIGGGAFSGCRNLTSVTIPNSVTTIYRNTFFECTSLTNIYASEEWKRNHWECAECLRSYQPAPAPESNPQPQKSGCYIATAGYGSYDCPQVWTLRRFRDYTLAKNAFGRAFIRLYYAVSPALVKRFGSTNWFRTLCKRPLDAFVAHLIIKGVPDTPYIDSSISPSLSGMSDNAGR